MSLEPYTDVMTPVAIASEPPQWWDIVGALGPLAILLAAGIAAIVGVLGLREKSNTDRLVLTQQTNADNRSEWWRRAQWALDNAMSADLDRRALGIGILTVLAYSELAKTEELAIFDMAWMIVPRVAAGESGRPGAPDNPRSPGRNRDSGWDGDDDEDDGNYAVGEWREKRIRTAVPRQRAAPTAFGNPVVAPPRPKRGPNATAELRVEVAAAKLRVVLDRRLGRETPSSVQSLAEEDY